MKFYIRWWQPQISISIRNIFFSQNKKIKKSPKITIFCGENGIGFGAVFADGPNVQISKTGHHIGGWDLYFKIKICPTLKLSPIACNVSRENVILLLFQSLNNASGEFATWRGNYLLYYDLTWY